MKQILKKISFLIMGFILYSCTNDNLETNLTTTITNQLKKDLKLDKFTNKNISDNVTVNWQNVKKMRKIAWKFMNL